MQPTAYFLTLCGRSLAWWLLANALGALLVYGQFRWLAADLASEDTGRYLSAGIGCALIIWLVGFYSIALLLLMIPTQLWVFSPTQPAERRGRLLLTVLGPFAMLIAGSIGQQAYWLLPYALYYLVASLLAAGWVFRGWL